MIATAYTSHPDDPGTLLVQKREHVPELMARPDVHTVIWQRNLGPAYREFFNAVARETLSNLGRLSLNQQLTLSFDTEQNIFRKIFSGHASHQKDDISKKMKNTMPGFLWRDALLMGEMVARLSGNPRAFIWPLIKYADDEPYSDDLFGNWHYDDGISAHMTVGDEVLELLNYEGRKVLSDHKSGKRRIPENRIPADAKIIRPDAADIVFFKDTIHRRAPGASVNGRLALSVFPN